MAKAKSSAPKRMRGIPEAIELKLHSLIRRINVVESTAVCVEMALLERRSKPDREIAICVEENIANELGRISYTAAALMAALDLQPPTPEVESPLLGMRIRPAMDNSAKSRSGRKVSNE